MLEDIALNHQAPALDPSGAALPVITAQDYCGDYRAPEHISLMFVRPQKHSLRPSTIKDRISKKKR